MNIVEFQCWLHGYMERSGDAPTKEEWHRIQQKLRDEVSMSKSAGLEAILSQAVPSTIESQ